MAGKKASNRRSFASVMARFRARIAEAAFNARQASVSLGPALQLERYCRIVATRCISARSRHATQPMRSPGSPYAFDIAPREIPRSYASAAWRRRRSGSRSVRR